MDCINGHAEPDRYSNGYCKQCAVEKARKWNRENRDKRQRRANERDKERRAEIKAECFGHYGGAMCSCCGETELVFLVLDHVEGGGGEHRQQIYQPSVGAVRRNVGGGGYRTYEWLKRHGYPPGYQVLCWNCNYAKEQGGCPHQDRTSDLTSKIVGTI